MEWHGVLKRPVYGFSSAPKAWYDRLLEFMEESGLDSKLSNEGVILMVNGDIVGLLALHVDEYAAQKIRHWPGAHVG